MSDGLRDSTEVFITGASADPAQSAPSAEPPYPSPTGIPVNADHWRELFDAGECLNCGKKLGDTLQWNCCWFGTIPEMWWRMTAEAAALRTAQLAEELKQSEVDAILYEKNYVTEKERTAQLERESESFQFDYEYEKQRRESAESALRQNRELIAQEAVEYLKGMAKLYSRANEHTASCTLNKCAIGIRTALLTVAAQTPQVSQQAKEEK